MGDYIGGLRYIAEMATSADGGEWLEENLGERAARLEKEFLALSDTTLAGDIGKQNDIEQAAIEWAYCLRAQGYVEGMKHGARLYRELVGDVPTEPARST